MAVKLTFNFSGSFTKADIVGKAATAKDKPKMLTETIANYYKLKQPVNR